VAAYRRTSEPYESQEAFAGESGAPSFHSVSASELSYQCLSIKAAASALGFLSCKALQTAIRVFCGG
jgi:hypothetical protein